MTKTPKTAVVLMNLGGPDSLTSVRNFLFNLFYDRSIIDLPNPFRWLVASLISIMRNKKAMEIYKLVGGKSPIMEETQRQKDALEKKLKGRNVKIFIVMRHYHPRSFEVAKEIKIYNPDEVIILPLYPQFSTTTTGSAVLDLKEAFLKEGVVAKQKTICCYFDDADFISSHASLISDSINKLSKTDNIRLLFSAHGLPKKIILNGDPYQWQIEETVKLIVKKLNIKNLDYKITYQSRVGPLEWLAPNTEEEVKEACINGKDLVIVPIAFVSEHVETLVELDIEYFQIAQDYNMNYIRVPTLSIDDRFIESLANLVINAQENSSITSDVVFNRKCPENFSKCLCNKT